MAIGLFAIHDWRPRDLVSLGRQAAAARIRVALWSGEKRVYLGRRP